MTESLKFTGPADILAFIPHSLGYQPEESFVLLTLQGKKLGATLRVDAPSNAAPKDYAQALVTYLAADDAATATVLAIYTNETGPDGARPYAAHVQALTAALDLAGMPLKDAWIITAENWRNYLCEDSTCCPARPLDAITTSNANAALIYTGSLVTGFTAPAPFTGDRDTRTAIDAQIPQGHPDDLARARALWAQILDNPAALTGPTARQLAAAFQHKMIRDYLMADVITPARDFTGTPRFDDILLGHLPARPDWARVDRAQELGFELMKATPEGQRAPLLSLIGWLDWLKGKASFAARYFKLATEDVTGFRLAVLLAELVNRGLIAPVAANKDTAYRPTRGQ
ncbi:DUF4192 domain-containing protein [Pseudarthrobacter albicanus]|uniref:DUF4192 domain-containing protein n=1 Tax=Pseudarthrobacter albicanus TaxID=2823873 RepID=UPI001BAD554D|nr:DUF4192 domain-containing protein [Pseudarthrobacter albicanus]